MKKKVRVKAIVMYPVVINRVFEITNTTTPHELSLLIRDQADLDLSTAADRYISESTTHPELVE